MGRRGRWASSIGWPPVGAAKVTVVFLRPGLAGNSAPRNVYSSFSSFLRVGRERRVALCVQGSGFDSCSGFILLDFSFLLKSFIVRKIFILFYKIKEVFGLFYKFFNIQETLEPLSCILFPRKRSSYPAPGGRRCLESDDCTLEGVLAPQKSSHALKREHQYSPEPRRVDVPWERLM